MTKAQVLKRLNATLKKLIALPDNKFYYGDFVRRSKVIDRKTGETCGTVCCVAGWYPAWFPEARLIWNKEGGLESELNNHDYDHYDDIAEAMMRYHGIGYNLTQVLFYGQKEEFYTNKFDRNLLTIELGIGETHKIPKKEVVKLFKLVIDLIKKDMIDYSR